MSLVCLRTSEEAEVAGGGDAREMAGDRREGHRKVLEVTVCLG